MPAPSAVTTIADLLALPSDGLRHELLDGAHVVTPAPRLTHQRVVSDLLLALRMALATNPQYWVLTSPADLVLGERTLVQPDLFVLRVDRRRPPTSWNDVGTPLVAIEVLSPGTAARDRTTKRRIYQRAGIAEYWIVDPDARLLERWRPGDRRPAIVEDQLSLTLFGVDARLDVRRLFEGLPAAE